MSRSRGNLDLLAQVWRERRVGLSAGYENGPFIANAGIFTDNIEDLGNGGDGINSDHSDWANPRLTCAG